jgi:hypothetical protein
MTVERSLRALAGIVILLSLALAHWVSPNWLWPTAFAGANLLQSAFTNWCPAMPMLRAIGFKDARCSTSEHGAKVPMASSQSGS